MGVTYLHGTSRSILSQRLALPPPNPRNYLHRTLYVTIVLGLMLTLGILFGRMMQVLPDPDLHLLIGVLAAWALALVLVGVGQQIRAAKEWPTWRTLHTVWERLYYCLRCDLVFLPEDPSSLIPSDRLIAVISSAPWQQAHLLLS